MAARDSGSNLTLSVPWMRVPRVIRENEAEGFKLLKRERIKGGQVRLVFQRIDGKHTSAEVLGRP